MTTTLLSFIKNFIFHQEVFKIVLRETLEDFLIQNKSEKANNFKDLKWLGGVHYLSFFKEINITNILLKGLSTGISNFFGKTTGMKTKLTGSV